MSRSVPAPAWALPRVFAHRCGGALAPENSLAGLRIAAAAGFRAVEFDVMLSADGSPWLIHDETLDRTTNGNGPVCHTHDDALAALDAGARRHPAFAGEPLPTLRDAARLCRALGLQANVEIKPASGFEVETGRVVARAIADLWQGAPWPLVSSFSTEALAAARAVAPNLPLGLLWSRLPEDWPAQLAALDVYSLHCAWNAIDDDALARARALGIPVLCYTVNERPQAEALFRRGASAIFSDRIDRMAGL